MLPPPHVSPTPGALSPAAEPLPASAPPPDAEPRLVIQLEIERLCRSARARAPQGQLLLQARELGRSMRLLQVPAAGALADLEAALQARSELSPEATSALLVSVYAMLHGVSFDAPRA